jgi:3-phenylpropionate/cinnamic acid dioxygenase small subunit
MNTAGTVDVRREIEEFYYREAWLLDHDKLEDWLKLLSDNVRYWAPVRRNVPRGTENLRELFLSPHFEENKAGLQFRVARSRTGSAFAEEVTRLRRFVTNVLVHSVEGGIVHVSSNFQLFRSRQDEQWFVGSREDQLRKSAAGDWLIQERMVILDHGVIDSITVYV